MKFKKDIAKKFNVKIRQKRTQKTINGKKIIAIGHRCVVGSYYEVKCESEKRFYKVITPEIAIECFLKDINNQ